jgi:hypothetical protein
MEVKDMVLIPIYVFIALIIFKALNLDAWVDWFLKLFKAPNHLEERMSDIERRITDIENKVSK